MLHRPAPAPGWERRYGYGADGAGWEPYEELFSSGPGRWRWLATSIAGALLIVMTIMTAKVLVIELPDRGWLTLALAAVLPLLLGFRRREGFGPVVRAVAEYIVVALLAVLLVSGSVHQAQAKPPPSRSHTTSRAASEGCPSVVQVREWLSCVWAAGEEASRHVRPSATTRPKGDAMPPASHPHHS